jgi:hypothetical protein
MQTPDHWDLIGGSMTDSLPLLPPNSDFPPPFNHCVLTPTRKNLVGVLKTFF